MFRMIKIIFNAFIIVLALIGFNSIGGQKYVEMAKEGIGNFIAQHNAQSAKKIGDFSKLNEEFQIDNTMSIAGYKAVIAEHKASGQKMVILDSGKRALLTKEDIKSKNVDKKLKDLSDKFQYQGARVQDITVTSRGTIKMYGQTVPYAKFDAHVTKLPFSDLSGIIASVQTSDGSEKLALSISEKKKYSQLITNEFYRGVNEGANTAKK
jgi:hypothetical protein